MDKLLKDAGSAEELFNRIISERRATSSFDGSPVPDDVLGKILRAGIEAPSGYNLQPWRFIVVRDQKQKQDLREAAMNQPKVEEAGAVIVFCGDLNAHRGQSLDKILTESEKHGFSKEQNEKVRAIIKKTFDAPAGNAMGLAPDYAVWVNRHVMIAFTTMMWMAEILGYDTAPMEGFFEDKVKNLLGIPEDIRVVALLAIGKRKGEDKKYAGRRQLKEICFAEEWGREYQ
ncbi:nitroreductase family protein [Legionella clemsonensis]|uniref:NADH dehydrogenase n=1 Tax=Legionella clemsonensis TaxID=1867846 RepID=A0A222P2W5_9GAMM|nr:nitroreductase family protein [Legionella clemsonensis]ASQ46171.1 NADH dehydrogenase [Legionella clemsonensis]